MLWVAPTYKREFISNMLCVTLEVWRNVNVSSRFDRLGVRGTNPSRIITKNAFFSTHHFIPAEDGRSIFEVPARVKCPTTKHLAFPHQSTGTGINLPNHCTTPSHYIKSSDPDSSFIMSSSITSISLRCIQMAILAAIVQAFAPHSKTSRGIRIGTDSILEPNDPTTTESTSSTTSLWATPASSFCTKFEELQSLESRLEVLERGAPSALTSFYEPSLKSFSIKPGSVEVCQIGSQYSLECQWFCVSSSSWFLIFFTYITTETECHQYLLCSQSNNGG